MVSIIPAMSQQGHSLRVHQWVTIYQVDIERSIRGIWRLSLLRRVKNDIALETSVEIRRYQHGNQCATTDKLSFNLEEIRFLKVFIDNVTYHYRETHEAGAVSVTTLKFRRRSWNRPVIAITVKHHSAFSRVLFGSKAVCGMRKGLKVIHYIVKQTQSSSMIPVVYGLLTFKIVEADFTHWRLMAEAIQRVPDELQLTQMLTTHTLQHLRKQLNKVMTSFHLILPSHFKFNATEALKFLQQCVREKSFEDATQREIVCEIANAEYRCSGIQTCF